MKHELLAPAGDIESLYQAIHNGADAVYLGLKTFGARAYSKNFDNDEIIKAIETAHLYGVKIYVTMNTLVKDSEVEDFLEQVEFLYLNGVDAIIMQDYGMINLVRRMYKDLEIHASTQANNSSIDTIKMYHDLGVKRVVLSRELSLDEIKKIDVDIELEVFIHGALCISYSGNCLMSSMIGNRSGNRGECAGSCRLKYDLLKDGKTISKNKYLLSTKELNTSYNFNELLNSNIKSFKIEGRMKSPEYVGFITRFYRKLIDKEKINIEEELNKLKTIYNRKFTLGNLFNSKDITNIDTPNHIGLEIGKVISITKDKIKIKLARELNQFDGIRFLESSKGLIVNYLYDEKNNLISTANNIVYIDNKIGLTTKDSVYKTLDNKLITSLKKYNLKKIKIKICFQAIKNNKIKVILEDNYNKVEVEGSIVKEAITSPITEDDVKKHLLKLGNTPFTCNDIKLNLSNNIFIQVKEINELIRTAVDLLIKKRSYSKRTLNKEKIIFEKLNSYDNNYLVCSVNCEEQLKTCLELDFKRIYVNDLDLYKKYENNKNIYYRIDRNNFNITNNLLDKNLVSEYLDFKDKNLFGNYSLNVYNIYTAYYLLFNGLLNIPVSVELNCNEINNLYNKFIDKFDFTPPLEILVYGRVENMIIKQNILSLDKNYKYDLIDKRKRCFKVFYKNNLTHILNYEKRNNIYSFNHIKRLDFYDESKEDIINIVKKFK